MTGTSRTLSDLSRRHALLLAAGALPGALNLPAFAETPKDPLKGRFGGPFSMLDHHARRVSDADFRGSFMLVYFGFVRCTDTCPIDLPMIAAAIDQLGPRSARLQPLFVTVDPEDTPSTMKDYVSAIHPRLIGLTGSEQEIASVARAYKVHRRKMLVPGVSGLGQHQHATHQHDHAGASYTIDHGSLTYLMGPDGAFLTLFPHNTGVDRFVAVLSKYLPER